MQLNLRAIRGKKMNILTRYSTILVLLLVALLFNSEKADCEQVPFINVMVSVLPLKNSDSSNSSLEYSINVFYVDHDGSAKIRSTTKNIPGSDGTTTFAFPGDYVTSCTIAKISGEGRVRVDISEGSKTVFTSNRAELDNPIVYTNSGSDDNSYSTNQSPQRKPKMKQLQDGTWTN